MSKEEAGKSEEEVYDEEGREDLVEGDGMSAEEDAFMRGYDENDEDKETTKESD